MTEHLSYTSLYAKMPPDLTLEHANFENCLGEHAPRPPKNKHVLHAHQLPQAKLPSAAYGMQLGTYQ